MAPLTPSLSTISFEKTYGGPGHDIASSIQQTLDGGYIIAGTTNSFGAGGSDVYLVRTDSLGDIVWTRTYGGIRNDEALCIEHTTDGGYVIGGVTWSFGIGLDFYLIKTDSLGSPVWTKNYGRSSWDYCMSVRQTSDGGYIMAGWTDPIGLDKYDLYLVKTDSLGDMLWTRVYGGDLRDLAQSVQETSDGGYIIAGATKSFGAGGWDVYLIKTDSAGDALWTKTYGGHGTDFGSSLQKTPNKEYIITGSADSFTPSFWADVYLIATDSLGDTLWTRTYGGDGEDDGHSVQETSDGGFIIAGRTSSFGPGNYSVYLIRTDSLGDTVWTRTYGGAAYDRGDAVCQTSDGGYAVVGRTRSFGAGMYDFYFVKTDENGLVRSYDPVSLKQDVVAELDTLKPQSKGMAEKIKKAKKHIEKSLDPKRWLDETHLHIKHGKKVFYEEKKAVKDIKKLCKKGDFPGELCERLIAMLVEADSILARVAIEDARASNGREKEIEKAEKEFFHLFFI